MNAQKTGLRRNNPAQPLNNPFFSQKLIVTIITNYLNTNKNHDTN